MSSEPWLTSLECSTSIIQSSGSLSTLSLVTKWLEFVFLTPCAQRILFSSVDLLFLLTCIVLAVHKFGSRFIAKRDASSSIDKPLLEAERPQLKVTLWFKVTSIVTAVLALSYIGICILAFVGGVPSPWNFAEAFFRLFQALSHIVILVLVAHEKKFGALYHPVVIRTYWVVSLVVVILFAATGVARLINVGEKIDQDLRIDDIYSLVSVPLYAFLFIVSIRGSSGITVVTERRDGGDLGVETHEPNSADANVSGYATASPISKATWLWMNPC